MRTLFIAILFLSSPAFGSKPSQFDSGTIGISLGLDYYTTNENFDDDAEIVELSDDNKFTYTSIEFTGSYDFNRDWSVFTNLDLGYSMSSTSTEDRERFAVSELGAGIQYSLLNQPIQIVPELKFSYPLGFNDEDGDEVYVGESAWSITPGVHFSYPISFLKPTIYVGYAYRGDGRASLLPWHANLDIKIKDFLIGTGVSGYEYMSEDDETGVATDRLNAFERVNAESQIFDSINPSRIDWKIWGGLYLGKGVSTKIGYRMDIRGVRSSHGSSFFAILDFLPSSGKSKTPPALNYRNIYEDDEDEDKQQFEVETYDSEKIFERALKPESEKKVPRKKRRAPKKRKKKQDGMKLKLRKKPTNN